MLIISPTIGSANGKPSQIPITSNTTASDAQAEAYARSGEPAEGLSIIDEVIEIAGSELTLLPEFYLLKGELLLAVAGVSGPAEATRGSFLHQLTDAGDHLAAEQLDVGHERLVGQPASAVLQVEARGSQRAQVGRDLLGHGLGRSDV